MISWLALFFFFQQPTAHEMPQEMVWVSREGKVLGRVGSVQNAIFFPEISPDGKSIAVSARAGQVNDRDIWIHEVASGAKRVQAPAKGNDNFPVWLPGGEQPLAVGRNAPRILRIGLPQQHRLVPVEFVFAGAAAGEQQTLFTHASKKRDLYMLNLEGDAKPKPVFPGAAYWTEVARFAPDGKSFAFVSNEAGPFEVYVANTDDPGTRRKVSRGLENGWGGVRWRSALAPIARNSST